MLARFLRALGVPDRAVPMDGEERAALYRTTLAGRRILVVLDDAGDESQVRPLLPGAPGRGVLVTGRRPLAGIEGSRWLPLDVLPAADSVDLLARIVEDGRVERQPAAAAEVARLSGGLPLAVRIVGARLTQRPTWDLTRIVDLLGDESRRLDRLAIGDLAVRASLSLGLRGLDDRARRLLRGLSLFDVPDFTAALCAAVPGTTDPDAPLEALVDAQLLAVTATDPAGQVRYRFHDLVRLHAREQAEALDSAADRAGVLERGPGTWLCLAERMATRIPGPCYAVISGRARRPPEVPDVRADPLCWFDAEWHTLLAAVRQACALSLDEVAFDLAGSLERYFDLRGMYSDWVAMNEQVLRLCRRTGNVLGEAVMLRGLLDVRMWIGAEFAPGGAPADAAGLLDLFARAGDRRGMSDAEVMRSWELTAAGRPAESVGCATRALARARETGHLGGTARAHVALAVAVREQGRPDRSVGHLARALDAARRLGNDRYEATILQFLGIVRLETGDLDAAERRYGESLAISHRYGDDFTETLTLLGLARVHAARGDPRAVIEAEAALALGREHDMTHHVAEALAVVGELELAAGRPAAAVTRLEEAVALWRVRGWLSYLAAALTAFGRARTAQDPAAGLAAWREAQALYVRAVGAVGVDLQDAGPVVVLVAVADDAQVAVVAVGEVVGLRLAGGAGGEAAADRGGPGGRGGGVGGLDLEVGAAVGAVVPGDRDGAEVLVRAEVQPQPDPVALVGPAGGQVAVDRVGRDVAVVAAGGHAGHGQLRPDGGAAGPAARTPPAVAATSRGTSSRVLRIATPRGVVEECSRPGNRTDGGYTTTYTFLCGPAAAINRPGRPSDHRARTAWLPRGPGPRSGRRSR